MKKIVIGFSRAAGNFVPFSWFIMAAQQNNFSHAYVRWHSDALSRDVIFQASGLAVNFMGFELFKQKEVIVKEFELEISDETFNKMMQTMIDLVGQPYSLLQILNSLIYILCKKSPLDNQIVGWDCSKLIAYLLQKELGFVIPEDLDVITPKDLCGFLEKLNLTPIHPNSP